MSLDCRKSRQQANQSEHHFHLYVFARIFLCGLDYNPMSLSNSESYSDSSSSSNGSFSIIKRLLDEPWGDDSLISTKMTWSLVQTIVVHVPIVILTMLRWKKRPHGGSTIGRRYPAQYDHRLRASIIKESTPNVGILMIMKRLKKLI